LIPMLLHASATGSKLGARGGIFSPMPAFNFTRASDAMNTVRLAQGGIVGERGGNVAAAASGDSNAASLTILRMIHDRLAGIEVGVQKFPTQLEANVDSERLEKKQSERAYIRNLNRAPRKG
jgi:hypothetical protein